MDLIGQKFGRLTVIARDGYHYYPNSKRKSVWKCICDCGNEISVIGSDLHNGHTQSCGCIRKETAGGRTRTHGKSRSRLYRIWCAIKDRCNNKTSSSYANYGGRGICVCQEWEDSFESFYDWANASGYNDDLSIDRIDVNGNYTPENCRWATDEQQRVNKRNTRYISFNGKTQSIKEWAAETGLAYSCLLYRLDHGWSVERALTVPSHGYHIPRGTQHGNF